MYVDTQLPNGNRAKRSINSVEDVYSQRRFPQIMINVFYQKQSNIPWKSMNVQIVKGRMTIYESF